MNCRSSVIIIFASALCISLAFSFAARAADAPETEKPDYGNVTVCYFTPNCTFPIVASGLVTPLSQAQRDDDHPAAVAPAASAVVDGPAFQITNTGTAPITSAKLKILADSAIGLKGDSFAIGTISPGNSFVVIPGLSNDQKKRKPGLFFYYSGSALDTSDVGPNANSVTFEFTGMVNGKGVTTGQMMAGTTAGPSNDKTVASINFLGGPGNADGPCNDCVGPIVIGTIH